MNGPDHITEIDFVMKLAELSDKLQDLIKKHGEQYLLYCSTCKQPLKHKKCVNTVCVDYEK